MLSRDGGLERFGDFDISCQVTRFWVDERVFHSLQFIVALTVPNSSLSGAVKPNSTFHEVVGDLNQPRLNGSEKRTLGFPHQQASVSVGSDWVGHGARVDAF